MKAAFINRIGPPEVIEFGDLADPIAGPGQCLIQVEAVDVNPIDVYVRGGFIPAALKFPYILGRDLAGTVLKVGPDTKRFRAGDRVWATGLGSGDQPGTFAQLVAVEESRLHPIPQNIAAEAAVAVSLVGTTAHLGLVSKAKVQPGEVLFVNGGTGGVGSCVVQMAKALGARVIATAGSPEKLAACRTLGADLALNYRTDDIAEEIRKFSPKGVDVWWETVRDPNFERMVPSLAQRGRIILMAGRDARPIFPVGPFYVKDCALLGLAMFNATDGELANAARDINDWLGNGKLRARIDRRMPLSAVVEAHRLQEESTIQNRATLAGKIILRPE